ncbi:MAG: site-specific integrase [Candidatus Obscuribacterales bacterium]|nr:site-specific integrase [Candidatus Obscuribacterales bacterium]
MPGQAKILSSQEIKAVFQLLKSPRDRALFAIGIYTGMRISEIITLKQDQIFTEGGVRYQIILNRLKKLNTVYSEIPIQPKLRQALIDYKKHLKESVWLFPSSRSEKGHITRMAAHDVLVKAFKTLNLEGAKTHSMRRTVLTTLSRSGVPLRTVQEISGHSSLSQLQAYLEVNPEDKHKALGQLKY